MTLARRAFQCERILAWALAGHVIHQDDWYTTGADGGGAIKAVRSRISELQTQQGYGFDHTRRADGTTEYRLAHVPELAAHRAPEPELAAVGDVDGRVERLFEPEPQRGDYPDVA